MKQCASHMMLFLVYLTLELAYKDLELPRGLLFRCKVIILPSIVATCHAHIC